MSLVSFVSGMSSVALPRLLFDYASFHCPLHHPLTVFAGLTQSLAAVSLRWDQKKKAKKTISTGKSVLQAFKRNWFFFFFFNLTVKNSPCHRVLPSEQTPVQAACHARKCHWLLLNHSSPHPLPYPPEAHPPGQWCHSSPKADVM